MKFNERKISGFGKYPSHKCKVMMPASLSEVKDSIDSEGIIPRGLGRSYGDASLNENGYVSEALLLNKYISFDEQSGVLHCEAGVTFEDILDTFVRRGWFLPVTPGTKYITVGGAIASDVHGKNHHKEGSFSEFLNSFSLMIADGSVVECSRQVNSELFWATIGGMGLTGYILTAEFIMRKIESPFISFKGVRVKNVDKLFDAFEEYDDKFVYSVAWIDIVSRGSNIGRSVLLLGNHSDRNNLSQNNLSKINSFTPKKKKNIPFEFPSFALNKLSVSLFNTSYYLFHPSKEKIIDYDTFFYPLDSILNWNNIYGKRGLTQYQLCVPEESASGRGREAIKKVLKVVTEYGGGSFLSVLKKMGRHTGMISFPIKGYTLSMDFPIKKGLDKMIDEMDSIVMEYGGRTYLTKDAFLNEAKFKRMYDGEWQKWMEVKRNVDPNNIFTSNLGRRIGLCPF